MTEYEQIEPDETDTEDLCPQCLGPVERKNFYVRYPDFLSPIRYRRWKFVCRDKAPTRSQDDLNRGIRTGNGCAWQRWQRSAAGAEAVP